MGEFLLEQLGRVVVNFLLLPLCLVVATPVVLIRAAFGSNSYAANVGSSYLVVVRFWGKWLNFFP